MVDLYYNMDDTGIHEGLATLTTGSVIKHPRGTELRIESYDRLILTPTKVWCFRTSKGSHNLFIVGVGFNLHLSQGLP